MPVSPDQVLSLTKDEWKELWQAGELIDAMLQEAKTVPYTIHAKVTEAGVIALHLIKDNRPYFVICSEQVVRVMLTQYKKAGWDVHCVIDSMHEGTYFYEGKLVRRGNEIRLVFTVQFLSWAWNS